MKGFPISSQLIIVFSESELATLVAAFNTVIPEDQDPGAWEGGVHVLLDEHINDFMKWSIDPLKRAISTLNEHSMQKFGKSFATLSASEQEDLFGEALVQEVPEISPSSIVQTSLAPINTIVKVAYEGYYGGTREPAGWKVAGFKLLNSDVPFVEPAPIPSTPINLLSPSYFAIIVGSGAGGGVVAAELAKSGKKVLLVEQSRAHDPSELRGNLLQGKREQLYNVTANLGPGHPRVLENEDGSAVILNAEENAADYGTIAVTLGGGTRLWQGMSWRFSPEDFTMATTYGIPENSTLADWPFTYDELAPYYDRIEWELGVAGDSESAVGKAHPGRRPFPMPAFPENKTREILRNAIEKIGGQASPIPLAFNSVPRDGRPACVMCNQCVGHSCPVNAKNGTHNTFIPRALATGNCDLIQSAQATSIEHDANGHATGVHIYVTSNDEPQRIFIKAEKIIVSAGAIESPRLLLASGLGNSWVGRNHHSHGIVTSIPTKNAPQHVVTGPGHSVASIDYVHRNGEAYGGGVIFDMPLHNPLILAQRYRNVAEFGSKHKEIMRSGDRSIGLVSMVQEVPDARGRITLDPEVKDIAGMPAARIYAVANPATEIATQYIADACEKWLEAAGGEMIVSTLMSGGSRGNEHSAGTCRFGRTPEEGAVDPNGLLFGTHNVYVADASVHVTNGGFNPALTVMANALRIAEKVLQAH